MLGVLTDNGKVNYISLDNFISIDKLKKIINNLDYE